MEKRNERFFPNTLNDLQFFATGGTKQTGGFDYEGCSQSYCRKEICETMRGAYVFILNIFPFTNCGLLVICLQGYSKLSQIAIMFHQSSTSTRKLNIYMHKLFNELPRQCSNGGNQFFLPT